MLRPRARASCSPRLLLLAPCVLVLARCQVLGLGFAFPLFHGCVGVGERMKISVGMPGSGWNIRCRGNVVFSFSFLFFISKGLHNWRERNQALLLALFWKKQIRSCKVKKRGYISTLTSKTGPLTQLPPVVLTSVPTCMGVHRRSKTTTVQWKGKASYHQLLRT
jgi:hypothetical protein